MPNHLKKVSAIGLLVPLAPNELCACTIIAFVVSPLLNAFANLASTGGLGADDPGVTTDGGGVAGVGVRVGARVGGCVGAGARVAGARVGDGVGATVRQKTVTRAE